LIENEEDLVDFPSPSTYTFTKDPIYKAYQPSRNGDVLACPEGGKCGDCSTSFHYAWELQWSRAKKVDHDRAMHYHQTEASKKSEPYWKVAHTKTHIIIECTSSCACVKNGTCTNNLVQKRRENPLPFVIFKSADERGWGLKCLQAIKYGTPVLEYAGEIISMKEFHKRETEQEATGTLYCLELPQEDETEDTYCIDSGFVGNHARFVNHSCDPNLDLFRVIGEERSPNRAVPVLFARRNIAIGEELTFNYNLKYEEEVDDDDENAEIENVTSEKRKFICKCSAGKKCQDYPWKPGEKEEWIAEKHQKRLEMRRRREQNKEKKKNVDKRKKSVGQSNKRKSDTLSRSDIKKSKL